MVHLWAKKPPVFVACITKCMKHQSQILWTLGVIFTSGVDPLQPIGVINTMSSFYRTRPKLLLIAALEDPDSLHLSLQIQLRPVSSAGFRQAATQRRSVTWVTTVIREARVSQIKYIRRKKLTTAENYSWETGNKGGKDFEDHALFHYSDINFPCWLLIDRWEHCGLSGLQRKVPVTLWKSLLSCGGLRCQKETEYTYRSSSLYSSDFNLH